MSVYSVAIVRMINLISSFLKLDLHVLKEIQYQHLQGSKGLMLKFYK